MNHVSANRSSRIVLSWNSQSESGTKYLENIWFCVYPLTLEKMPNWSCIYRGVYSFSPENAKLLGHSSNPSSWTKTNLPKVTSPTRVSGGRRLRLCYRLSFTAFNSDYGTHRSRTKRKILGYGADRESIYSMVV